MKLFTQLALVTAIATCGSAAYAMQSMDDAALSDTTGQDGITILIAPPTISAADTAGYTANGETVAALTQTHALKIGALVLHDKDGLGAGTTAGAIIIGDASQANSLNAAGIQFGLYGTTPIIVTIDSSGGTGVAGVNTGAVLNVNVVLPRDMLIRTGDISIDGSNDVGGVANVATGATAGKAVKILNSMDIAMGGASMNIQLGNTPQGAMINMAGTVIGGLQIKGLSLHDGNQAFGTLGGDLGVGQISITDTGASNLTMAASIDVVKNVDAAWGLPSGVFTQRQGGLIIATGGPASDIMMSNITLGSATSTLGDLQLINLQMAGSHIAIMGH